MPESICWELISQQQRPKWTYRIPLLNVSAHIQYAISQLQIVRSCLHWVNSHLPRCGQLFDKSTETTLHVICKQFLRFSDSSKPSSSVCLIYEFAWLAGIRKSEENLLKTSCKVAPGTKSCPHILMTWRQSKTIGKCPWTLVRCQLQYSIFALFLTLPQPYLSIKLDFSIMPKQQHSGSIPRNACVACET